MGVGSLANGTSDSHALRASGRATRLETLGFDCSESLPDIVTTTRYVSEGRVIPRSRFGLRFFSLFAGIHSAFTLI